MSELKRSVLARLASVLVGSGAALVGYLPAQTGAQATTVQAKLQERVSVLDYMLPAMRADVISGTGAQDHTAAIQAAINAAIAGPIKSVYFPDGAYNVTGSLTIGTSNTSVVTGLRFYGESIQGVVLTQATANTPLFLITVQYLNTCLWENMTLKFAAMQTGNAAGSIFRCNGLGTGSVFECVWRNIRASNFYYFVDSPTVLWWGNALRDCWFGDFAYGVTNISGAAGEPRCTFENLYVSCQSATGVLFTHNAMTAMYDGIEVNAANSGATMLYDGGGGNHIIKHWALEVATYNTNATLFNVPNGIVLAQLIYTNTLTLGANVSVNAFKVSGANSYLNIREYQVGPFAALPGTASFIACNAGGPRRSSFGHIEMPFATNVLLCDIGGTVTANYLTVDEWNDAGSNGFLSDADETLTYNAPVNQWQDVAQTANRIKTINDNSVAGSQLFSGRRYRFIKTNTAAYTLTVKSANGTTLATIPAGSKGIIEVVWQRSGQVNAFAWLVAMNQTFT